MINCTFAYSMGGSISLLTALIEQLTVTVLLQSSYIEISVLVADMKNIQEGQSIVRAALDHATVLPTE